MRLATLIPGLFLALVPAATLAQSGPPRPYKLSESSQFQTGCFTICDCAVFSRAMGGTFGLELVAPGPLFDEYRVHDVRWFLDDPTAAPTITGSGTYRLGGEVAVQHQMVLDLSIDGGPVVRFDSGLVTTTNGFPSIEIRIPLHGDSACVDTVLVIHAAPMAATGVEGSPAPGVLELRSARSPFREHAELTLRAGSAGAVEIQILDVHGRVLRRWTRGGVTPGDHRLTWDGRTSTGEEAATGLYLVRARQAGRSAVARVIRVR